MCYSEKKYNKNESEGSKPQHVGVIVPLASPWQFGRSQHTHITFLEVGKESHMRRTQLCGEGLALAEPPTAISIIK